MALLLCSNGLRSFDSCLSQTQSSSSSFTVNVSPVSSFHQKRTNLTPKSCSGLFEPPLIAAKKRTRVFTKPSSSNTTDEADDAHSESIHEDEEGIAMLDLPLDAKLQNKLEKKLRMKVAKSIRLRQKKLGHKRRLRKKGRWPPSNVKKSSNV